MGAQATPASAQLGDNGLGQHVPTTTWTLTDSTVGGTMVEEHLQTIAGSTTIFDQQQAYDASGNVMAQNSTVP